VHAYDIAGNMKDDYAWTGSYNLIKHFTYDAHGVVQTATDVNNTVTTYSGFFCNGTFPGTTTSNAVTWTTSATWDCNGGVLTRSTDANGQPTSYTYNDPLWRPTSVTDALNNTTNISYISPTQTESVLNFGTSTVDTLTTLDVLGRVNWVQKK